MTTPDDLAVLDHGCSGDAGHVEVLGQLAVFLGGWIAHVVFLDELDDLLFGRGAAELGQTNHLELALVAQLTIHSMEIIYFYKRHQRML